MRKGGWQKDLHFSYKICAILLTVTVKKMSGFCIVFCSDHHSSYADVIDCTCFHHRNVEVKCLELGSLSKGISKALYPWLGTNSIILRKGGAIGYYFIPAHVHGYLGIRIPP